MEHNKIQPRHAMIDLETMGLLPNAPIVSIGAVIFDPRYNVITDETFYVELDWKNQRNRVPCKSTQQWWLTQSQETRAALKGTADLEEALDDLAFFLPDDVKVWGNGPGFDITKLEVAYDEYDQEVPWKFWNVRCCRTIKDMFESKRGGFDKKMGSGKHNALQDAIFQANYVNDMWKQLLGED